MNLYDSYDIVPSLYTTLPSFEMRCCVSTWTAYCERLRHSSTTTQWTPTPSKPQYLKPKDNKFAIQASKFTTQASNICFWISIQALKLRLRCWWSTVFLSSPPGQTPNKTPRQETWRSHHLRLFNLPSCKAKTSRSFSSPWVWQELGSLFFGGWSFGCCVFFFGCFAFYSWSDLWKMGDYL